MAGRGVVARGVAGVAVVKATGFDHRSRAAIDDQAVAAAAFIVGGDQSFGTTEAQIVEIVPAVMPEAAQHEAARHAVIAEQIAGVPVAVPAPPRMTVNPRIVAMVAVVASVTVAIVAAVVAALIVAMIAMRAPFLTRASARLRVVPLWPCL